MTENKKVKKYQKVIIGLTSDIETGKLKPNQQLPSENDLSEIYSVSRITVRKALSELVLSRIITKSQGRSTIVNNQIIDKKLNEVVSFTKSSLLRNEQPSTRVILVQLVDPSVYIAKMLNIDISDKVWQIKRVRYTNDFPLIYEESFWISKLIGPVTKQIAEGSMFSYIKTLGIMPKEAKQDLDAVVADEELAKELEVHVGFPLLRSTMIIMDSKHVAFEISFSYHRTDRVKLSLIRNLNE
ncbi:MAG: GntR family transcriptional regulator [Erysipelotrichaceae bacterium]|nr:MAG: GntR family transcriptional [Erysipelotrichaceae bacterium]TXT16287.1 MAG: GntR family transcriptional regulator [Erysipelotrichaceae bacterium]